MTSKRLVLGSVVLVLLVAGGFGLWYFLCSETSGTTDLWAAGTAELTPEEREALREAGFDLEDEEGDGGNIKVATRRDPTWLDGAWDTVGGWVSSAGEKDSSSGGDFKAGLLLFLIAILIREAFRPVPNTFGGEVIAMGLVGIVLMLVAGIGNVWGIRHLGWLLTFGYWQLLRGGLSALGIFLLISAPARWVRIGRPWQAIRGNPKYVRIYYLVYYLGIPLVCLIFFMV